MTDSASSPKSATSPSELWQAAHDGDSPLRTSPTTHALFRSRTARWGEKLLELFIRTVAFSAIAVIALIFLFIAREALGIFTATDSVSAGSSPPELYSSAPQPEAPEVYNPEASSPEESATSAAPLQSSGQGTAEQSSESLLRNLLSTTWQPVSSQPKYGILPLVVGTLKIALLSILFAAPLGILGAIYAAFFAPRWVRELLKPMVEILAGFPSVVIGFFCLAVLASVVQEALGTTFRLNALVGSLGVAIAIVPVIFTISEDSLSRLPRTLWEAGLALGARPWQVVFRILVPAATPGLFAATLLGFGRAFGETMIVLMASGNAPLLSWSPVEPVRTLSATIGSEMGEVVWGSLHYSVLFVLGLLLFVGTFLLNVIAEFWVRQRLLRRFGGITSV